MSFKHTSLVIDHSKTRGPNRAILLILAFRADETTGECWPSINRIAKDTGLNRRTVLRCLPVIQRTGELLIVRRGHKGRTCGGIQESNRYRITIEPSQGRGRESLPLPDKVGTQSPEGRGSESDKGGAESPEGRGGQSPESSLNINLESSLKKKAALSAHKYFQKPTPEQVTEYGKRIGFVFNGQTFCDYYESKGWLIGKSPMKDWHAAVRTWKTREENSYGRGQRYNPNQHRAEKASREFPEQIKVPTL